MGGRDISIKRIMEKKIAITKEQSAMIDKILAEKNSAIQKEQMLMVFIFKGHGINPEEVTEIKINETDMVVTLIEKMKPDKK